MDTAYPLQFFTRFVINYFNTAVSALDGRTKILSTRDKFMNSSVNHKSIVFCRKFAGLGTEMLFILYILLIKKVNCVFRFRFP